MVSIYRIHVYIRVSGVGGEGGGWAPPEANDTLQKLNGGFSFIVSQDIFFIFYLSGQVIFLKLFLGTDYYFLPSSEPDYFFLAKPETFTLGPKWSSVILNWLTKMNLNESSRCTEGFPTLPHSENNKSCVMRKPVFWVCDQFRYKSGCSTAEFTQ